MLKCKRCGHKWMNRTEEPYKCPKCQRKLEISSLYNKETNKFKLDTTE